MEVLDVVPQYLQDAGALPWQEHRIMPIGDIQYGSDGTDIPRLKRHIEWGVEHDVMFIGTGDYSDFLSPSNRRFLRNAGLYDTATNIIERWHEEHQQQLEEILRPTRGRWLGLVEGHHFYEYGDGTTTDTRLCQFLGAPFLGTCGVVRLQFVDSVGHRRKDCLIWVHHGEGGSDNPLLRLKKVAPGFPQIDIFLMGHNTKLAAEPLDALEFYGPPGSLRLRDRTQLFVACGGFMRGYQQGSRQAGRANGSYVEKGMMRPSSLGGPLIFVTPRAHHDYSDLDIKVSI